MSNNFSLPPILQEFDNFVSLCKKMSTDLSKAGARVSELETDLAKEKAERRNLQNTSHKKIQELTEQSEKLRTEIEKNSKIHRDDAQQLRSMLTTAQNEHKAVLKIVQEELERTKAALQAETRAKEEIIDELRQIQAEYERFLSGNTIDQEAVKKLTIQLKTSREELEITRTHLKQTQEDYARVIENSGRTEESLISRENELRLKLQSITQQVQFETDAKNRINTAYTTLKAEYDKLVQHIKNRQEATTYIAPHVRDEEMNRLQDQIIKLKENQQKVDDARRSANTLATQMKRDLDSAKSEVERLKAVNPIKALLSNKEQKIEELNQHLKQLPEQHPERKELTSALNAAISQKRYFEQLLKET